MTNGLNDTGPTIELAKPADPIVWDGSDAMIAEVTAAHWAHDVHLHRVRCRGNRPRRR